MAGENCAARQQHCYDTIGVSFDSIWRAVALTHTHTHTQYCNRHPWIFGLGEEPYTPFQNPYFMPWEYAVAQWTVRPEDYYSAMQGLPDKKHHTRHKSHKSRNAKDHYTPEPEYDDYSPEKKAQHGKPHRDA